MIPYLLRRLNRFARLSPDEEMALERAVAGPARPYDAGEDLIHEGDPPGDVILILEGWAQRYKVLEDGRRQVIAYLLPGDFCDLKVSVLREMDHSISAATPLRSTGLNSDALDAASAAHPRLAQALAWSGLVSESIQREWTVNLGQRSAVERLGHLFCELHDRLDIVGLVKDHAFDLPLTQAHLGDAAGISTVHVNRSIQELRARRLIELKGRRLRLPDHQALCDASLYNPNYLHLDREGRHLDANG